MLVRRPVIARGDETRRIEKDGSRAAAAGQRVPPGQGYSNAMKRPTAKLPADVEADQIWKDANGQHYKVFSVHGEVATLQRCTPAGRVLSQRYRLRQPAARMQAEFELVRER